MYEFIVRLLGAEYLCRSRYSETRERLLVRMPDRDDYAVGPLLQSGCAGTEGELPVVEVRPEDWEAFPDYGLDHSAVSEASFLTACFSEAMLARDCVLLHGVAIRWRDRAYLICAAPGTGKSTQARFLQELRPGEFGVICGDRPILEFRQSAPRRDGTLPSAASPAPGPSEPRRDGTLPSAASPVPSHCSARSAAEPEDSSPPIIVHPSPWNGKENWHGAEAAPLAGLILLERGGKNRLAALAEREAVLAMYPHFIQTGWDPELIRRVAELEARLLCAVPIWNLTSYEVPDSTRLLLENVFD